jgi:hypothetical protein
VVQPVTTATMARHQAHGPNLQVAMFQEGTPPPEVEVVAVCERLRRHLAGDPGR